MKSAGKKPVIALVVYAKRSVRDLAHKAFLSIAEQTRKPDKLIVVDDQSESGFDDVKERVIDLRVDKCHVQVLRNERTPGLSGAMNTALLKLMEYADERSTYVTFVREEDHLESRHFESVERLIRAEEPDVVFSDVNVDGRKALMRMARGEQPSCHLERLFGFDLDHASCLMAAPCTRLESLLEAGMFNEALIGMQMHELFLRLSELPGAVWRTTGDATIKAPPSGYHRRLRDRAQMKDPHHDLEAPVLLAMRRGSRTFNLLSGSRLDNGARQVLHRAIRSRRDRLDPKTRDLTMWGVGYDLKPMKAGAVRLPVLTTSQRKLLKLTHIVVGIISRSNQPRPKHGLLRLLRELRWLSGRVGSVHVEILDNAKRGEPSQAWFSGLAVRRGNMSVSIARDVQLPNDATAKGFQASIARARTEIQRRVSSYIRMKPGRSKALAWLLDEDLSLANRAMCWTNKEAKHWFLLQLTNLLEKMKGEAESGTAPAMVLGQVTEAPPVPGTMTYRLQLLDAVTAVRRLRLAPREETYRFRDFHRVLEKWMSPGRRIRDFYYDVSSRDSMHLEFPFDYFPWENGEFGRRRLTNAQVLRMLVGELPKLKQGKQVFRPIFADRHFAVDSEEMPYDGLGSKPSKNPADFCPSVLRGGNTLFPNGSECRRYPTVTLRGAKDHAGRPITPRRADMISAVICRYLHGKQVVAYALPFRQQREDEGNKSPKDLLNRDKYIPDTEGFAIYSALKDILDDRQLERLDTKRGKHAKEMCDFGLPHVEVFSARIDEHRKARTRAIIASFYRIRGLAKILDGELGCVKDVVEPAAIDAAREFIREVIAALPRGFDCHKGTRKKVLSSPLLRSRSKAEMKSLMASRAKFLRELRQLRKAMP